MREKWITDNILMKMEIGEMTAEMKQHTETVFANNDFEALLAIERYFHTDEAYQLHGQNWLWRKEIVTAHLDFLARTTRRPDGSHW